MIKNNLLASVALFGELYENKKNNVGDVLADFIKGAVSFEQKYSLNSTELRNLLLKIYGFEIPESVVRTTVRNRLKNCATSENGLFHFNSQNIDTNTTTEEVQKINQKQEVIIVQLGAFIKTKNNNNLSNEEVWQKLRNFLIDNSYEPEYTELISAFIISNEKNTEFNDVLNAIKEGLVLYQGLCYSADFNQLGSWKDELTIYLSPEHLFSCIGYNGILFKEIFDDFISLVKEINNSEKPDKNGIRKGIIHLKYFENTKKEVNIFFDVAELIKKGKTRLDPTKTAMVEIVNTCRTIDDIKRKQAAFYSELKKIKIELVNDSYDVGKNPEYNLTDKELINTLKNDAQLNHRDFDENYCEQYLRLFSSINYFRKGINNTSFEKIKHIYITENRFVTYLGHNTKVKFNGTDVSFAKDIDFIITKFWFKLNKGFNNNTLPKSFDIVNRAKLIMSSRINNSLSEKYEKLKSDSKEKKLSEDEALELNNLYKENTRLPEDINSSNIDDSLNFLFDDDYAENFLREKTRKETEHKETKDENEKLKEELEKYKQKEEEQKKQEEKEKAEREKREKQEELENKGNEYALGEWKKVKRKCFFDLCYCLLILLLTLLPILVGLGLKFFKPMNDWLILLNNHFQIIIWVVLIIVFLIETFGRSYIFNKEKIKNGWMFLWIVISFKCKSFRKTEIDKFKNKYYATNHPQQNNLPTHG